MGFTYTDKNKKTILHSWGRFRGVVLAAVEVGDLLNFYNIDNASTLRLADQSTSIPAQAVACQDGAAGDTIWCALAAEIGIAQTIGGGGVVSVVYFAEAADFLGAPLYVGESGKPQSSAGATYSQLVGYLLGRDRLLFVPNTALTGVAGSFTTLAASGALTVTDATESTTTLTGSIKTAGGIGIVKNAYIGGVLNVAGAGTITGALTQTGVATFAARDVHSAGLTVANAFAVVEGMIAFPKITVTVLTSGAGYNMSAAQLLSGCISDTSATGAIAATLPSVAAVVALIPGYVVGTAFYLDYRNPGNQTVTLTVDAGAQWTLVGTMTIATVTHKRFLCVINSATTGTIYSVGASTA